MTKNPYLWHDNKYEHCYSYFLTCIWAKYMGLLNDMKTTKLCLSTGEWLLPDIYFYLDTKSRFNFGGLLCLI
ncbi:hypothetical protein VCRA2130O400_960013 [Vibrio crassostreae]|nr:hypothetical protein VCRA2119O381_330021 [Vibrio crassostreae]CAK4029869.1 hypothetical protein VCRA2130O400_960013 [Vibrio crassostreae]CDT01268.1 hypothetical protein VCR15J5_120081 [Vibrio crassostreae]